MPDLDKLLALTAGPELDAAVWEHVFGYPAPGPGCSVCTRASTSHDACAAVLEEIERRSLRKSFLLELEAIAAECDSIPGWYFVAATPAQKCKAALVAVLGDRA